MKEIKLGYEIGAAKEIRIPVGHMLVTGVSQYSGKTTALESMMKRGGYRGIVFRTKIGEKSFLSGNVIPPYFKDRSDWQFIKGVIESTMKQKVRTFEQAKIIQLSKKSGNSLVGFKRAVDERLTEKINSFETDILTNLQAYLEIVLPKLQSITFSEKLELHEGLNIIDLERFAQDVEVQSLIIHSVLEEILYKFKNTVTILPESWKFIPQDRGSPCKLIVEEFIRQAATNNNFIWIDSQDITGIDKTPVKQITQYLLGYQSEPNEVKKTLDHLPMPKTLKPTPDEIMRLGKGKFIYASRDFTSNVYIQPFWLNDDIAIQIAKGEKKVEELDAPKPIDRKEIVQQYTPPAVTPGTTAEDPTALQNLSKEIHDLSDSSFTRFIDCQQQIDKLAGDVIGMKHEKVDVEAIISRVKQSIEIPKANPGPATINEDALFDKIMARLPDMGGAKVYKIAPLEKLKKDFLEDAKKKILDDVGKLTDDSKRMLKYLESRDCMVKTNELVEKCFMNKAGGTSSKRVSNAGLVLQAADLSKKGTHSDHGPRLKERIIEMIQVHGATEQEIKNLHQHIIMEML